MALQCYVSRPLPKNAGGRREASERGRREREREVKGRKEGGKGRGNLFSFCVPCFSGNTARFPNIERAALSVGGRAAK